MNKSSLSDNNIAWEHVLAGRYAEAIQIYERTVPNSNRLGEWNNFGLTFLLAGDTMAALSCFLKAKEMPMGNKVVAPFVGTTFCCQGEYEKGLDDWLNQNTLRKEGKLLYFDESGGVEVLCLMWLVGKFAKLEQYTNIAVHELNLLQTHHNFNNSLWPASIARFLLKEIPTEKLVEAATNGVKSDSSWGNGQSLRASQAHFYGAMLSWQQGDYKTAQQLFTASLQSGKPYRIVTPEYHLAGHFSDQLAAIISG